MDKIKYTSKQLRAAARYAKKVARKRLDDMPLLVKEQNGLIAFTPVIPSTEQERIARIDYFAEQIVIETLADASQKTQILDKLEGLGINVSVETPPSVLKLAVKNTMKQVPVEVLLEKGVFGKPCTAEQAALKRKEIMNGAAKQLLKEIRKTV